MYILISILFRCQVIIVYVLLQILAKVVLLEREEVVNAVLGS